MAYLSRVSRFASGKFAVNGDKQQEADLQFAPMSELDLMISMGWGDTPQPKLPADWRTTRKPAFKKPGKQQAQE